MALSISPLIGNTLTSWSFVDTPPMQQYWGDRKLYFMMLIYGVDNSPITFDLIIEVRFSNVLSHNRTNQRSSTLNRNSGAALQ